MKSSTDEASAGRVLIVPAIAAAFWTVHLIGSFWRYFGIGTPAGNGMALLGVVLPIAAALMVSAAVVVSRVGKAKGWSARKNIIAALCLMGILSVTLLFLEAWRTRNYPKERTESFSGFLSHYLSPK